MLYVYGMFSLMFGVQERFNYIYMCNIYKICVYNI